MNKKTIKDVVLEFLSFLEHKIDTDSMTMDDVKALADAIMHGLPVTGTVSDFASFYGRTEGAVRHVISRSVLEKPRRRVHYTFSKFSSRVPDSWRKLK